VKYLANPAGGWINEHRVHFGHPACDSYALVLFEDLLPIAAIVFPRDRISEVCSALGRRHSNQNGSLGFPDLQRSGPKFDRCDFPLAHLSKEV
jgi:hypothetical protein